MSNIIAYRVTVEQKVRLPQRSIDDTIERVLTVRTKSKQAAKSAIKRAGIKGRIIKVEAIRG